MRNIKLVAGVVIISIVLTGCAGLDRLSRKNKNDVANWVAKKNLEQEQKEQLARQQRVERDRQKNLKDKQFNEMNPEVPIPKMAVKAQSQAERDLQTALNEMRFVTRYPGTQDTSKIYMKLGNYQLPLWRIELAITEYANDCKRVSAYSGQDYKNLCISNLARGLADFSKMSQNSEIPDKTKVAALNESSYNSYINFNHAAKLAVMHAKLCRNKGNVGYVAMVAVAAPCSGRGDIYNIGAARRAGLL